jgi:transposase
MYTEQDRKKIMATKNYRVFTEEFRKEALELLKSSGKSVKQIEQDLGITPGLLRKWRVRYQVVSKGSTETSLEPSDIEAAKREIARLKRELMEITEEREILKKVVNISSGKVHEVHLHRRKHN